MVNRRMKEKKKLTPWIILWYDINKRCNNSNASNYKYYGYKGIKNLLSQDDVKFLWFRDKAYEMKKPSIDRIDSNGHYCLENCRFIEMKENISRAFSKPVLQYDLNGNFIREWKSATKASSYFKGSETSIRHVLYGKNYTAFGFQWKYKLTNDFPKKINKALRHQHLPTNSKPIIQLDLMNNVIKEFSSAKEAHRKTNIEYTSICESANNCKHTAGGYKWRYK